MPQDLEFPIEGGRFERLPDGTLVRLSERLKMPEEIVHEAHAAALVEMGVGSPEPGDAAPGAADGPPPPAAMDEEGAG